MKPGENQDQLIMQSFGGNLETTFLVAQATGSYVYTNMRSKWKEIMSTHTSPNVEDTCWSALTDTLRDLPLKFLLQVDPGFVSHIREKGKLEQIRRCLRKIYVEINKTDDSRDILSIAKGFASEIKDEYRSFQEEWKTVEVDLKKWMGKDFKHSLTTSVEARMNLTIPSQGFKLKTIPRLIVTQKNKDLFRNSVSMAMFIDYKQ
ncbi:MAG TPA: hypothetical protein DCZ97_15945 [Syntrophus sp. (in: bacteria)]|nr:hypothetical protein [Syntrophus sp. (in: bacteria)]